MVAVKGYAPPPARATLADLIYRYRELHLVEPGKTKATTLEMLKRDPIGAVKRRRTLRAT